MTARRMKVAYRAAARFARDQHWPAERARCEAAVEALRGLAPDDETDLLPLWMGFGPDTDDYDPEVDGPGVDGGGYARKRIPATNWNRRGPWTFRRRPT